MRSWRCVINSLLLYSHPLNYFVAMLTNFRTRQRFGALYHKQINPPSTPVLGGGGIRRRNERTCCSQASFLRVDPGLEELSFGDPDRCPTPDLASPYKGRLPARENALGLRVHQSSHLGRFKVLFVERFELVAWLPSLPPPYKSSLKSGSHIKIRCSVYFFFFKFASFNYKVTQF